LRKEEFVEREQKGRIFRSAWIAGVQRYYPETPKESYIAPWEAMAEWEQASAIAVYEQVEQFVEVTNRQTAQLSREQKGRFVALCWIGQIYARIPNPKLSYVADWEQLPEWQKQTDSDIFEAIEKQQ
jgi:hypothetical protein